MMDLAIDVPWLLPTLFWTTGLAIGYAIHAIGVRMAKQSAERLAREIESRAKGTDLEETGTLAGKRLASLQQLATKVRAILDGVAKAP